MSAIAPDAFAGRRVIVLGGAGFIGSHIVDALAAAHAEVTVIDPCIPGTGGTDENLRNSTERIDWVKCPIEDVADLGERLSAAEIVIDAMGFTLHSAGLEDPLRDLSLNYNSHLALARALPSRFGSLFYLGSRSQYGGIRPDHTGPLDEDGPTRPLDLQGIHKQAAESMLGLFAKRRGWRFCSLRIAGVYGPRQPATGPELGMVGEILTPILDGQVAEIYGTPTRWRQIIYVEDAVSQILSVIAAWDGDPPVINVPGEAVVLSELAQSAITWAHSGRVEFRERKTRPGFVDPADLTLDDSRLRTLVPDPVRTPLDVAVARTMSDLAHRRGCRRLADQTTPKESLR